jgi:hypothetical protein
VDGTLQTVQDGDATDSALQVSTGAVASTGTLKSTSTFTVGNNKCTISSVDGSFVSEGSISAGGGGSSNTFLVAGASGNTYIAGTLGVNGLLSASDNVDVIGNVSCADLTATGTSTLAVTTVTTITASGAATLNGAVTLGDAAGDTITVNGTLAGTLQGTPTVSLTSVTIDNAADKVLIQDAGDSNKLKIASLSLPSKFASSLTAVPAAGATATIAHGLSGDPQNVRVLFVENDAGGDLGWAQNDGFDIWTVTDTTEAPAFVVYSDATNVYVLRDSDSTIKAKHKSTGVITVISDTTKWRIKVVATYIP